MSIATKRFLTPGLLTGALFLLLSVSVAEGWLRSRDLGICFGSCDAERRKEFIQNYGGWAMVSAQCGDIEEQRSVLTRLSLELAYKASGTRDGSSGKWSDQNSYFAEEELAGTLTVGQRDEYLETFGGFDNSPLAFITSLNTQTFPAGFVPPNGRLIRRCVKDGFHTQWGSIDGYCEGYTFLAFAVAPEKYGVESTWDELVGYIYDHRGTVHAEGTNNIEERIKIAMEAYVRHVESFGPAEDAIRAMPASAMVGKSDSERAEMLIRKRCEILTQMPTDTK